MRRVLIVGAGGRDFHNFNVHYRDDADCEVVGFTATQIPGIERRTYPAVLAGPRYPSGIAIHPEAELEALIATHQVDDVVLAYSDLSHEDVMHKASRALACGASFTLLGPRDTCISSIRPVVAVCATRTGCGKSQTARAVAHLLEGRGLKVAMLRHPMPYRLTDLAAMAVQRFATLADIDAAAPTVEEREEYEQPVREGLLMYAGVDYEQIVRRAEAEADVLVWDGGNNDFSFVAADLTITVTDPLRPGHELRYHPGETNLRQADVVVINKTDSAEAADVAAVEATVGQVNPSAVVVRTASPVTLDPGPSLAGLRALVIEDGPTITHGGMSFGAGTVAARRAGATLVDPRPTACGELIDTFARYPHIGPVLPAMGYSPEQLRDLARTIEACDCDVVVVGTPIDLGRLITIDRPIRRASYTLADAGHPTLADALEPYLARWA